MQEQNEANRAVVDPEADLKYIKELQLQIEELKVEKEKEYFARLNAEFETRKYRDAFEVLVKEVANLHK